MFSWIFKSKAIFQLLDVRVPKMVLGNWEITNDVLVWTDIQKGARA